MEDFELIKSLSGAAGLIIFFLFFIGLLIWILRPSIKQKMEDHGKSIFDEENQNG